MTLISQVSAGAVTTTDKSNTIIVIALDGLYPKKDGIYNIYTSLDMFNEGFIIAHPILSTDQLASEAFNALLSHTYT